MAEQQPDADLAQRVAEVVGKAVWNTGADDEEAQDAARAVLARRDLVIPTTEHDRVVAELTALREAITAKAYAWWQARGEWSTTALVLGTDGVRELRELVERSGR